MWDLDLAARQLLPAVGADPDGEVTETVERHALVLAAHGYVGEAIELAERLVDADLPYAGNPHRDRAWLTLGRAFGRAPGWLADPQPSAAELALRHRIRQTTDPYSTPRPEAPEDDQVGVELYRSALAHAAPRDGRLPGQAADARALRLLDRLVPVPVDAPVSGGLPQHVVRRGAALGAELAVRAGDLDRAREFLRRWYAEESPPTAVSCAELASFPAVAAILAGVVAALPPTLDPTRVGQHVASVQRAISVRLGTMPAPEASPPREWPGLVDALVRLAAEEGDLPEDYVRAPTDPAEIDSVERRLGVTLPADYRELLLVADGVPGSEIRPAFLPVRRIDAVREVQGEWMVDVMREHFPEYAGGLAERAIQISDPELSDVSTYLLVPVAGADGGERWEFWDHQEYAVVRHRSLREFVERELLSGVY